MQIKKLAIISDCLHVQTPEGKVGTDNPVFLRQMQALASGFEETLICCPFVLASNFNRLSYYTDASIHFLQVPNAGGSTLRSKLGIISALPHWYNAFKKINNWADVVYQRFPNNINIPGLFYFYYTQKKVFATYTGNWYDYKDEPFTYRLQKKLVKKWFKGPAGVYFEDNKYPHIFKTFSPSYTLQDWQAEAPFVEAKKLRWKNNTNNIPVFIAVGILSAKKNQQFILDSFLVLKNQGFTFQLYIAGDGILKETYKNFVSRNNLTDCVYITGKLNDEDIKALYRRADFLVHASLVEGYVKVPVEGFFHGVIPIINNISIANEIIGNNERGYIFSVNEKEQFIELIKDILLQNENFLIKIERGRLYAYERTIELWQNQILNTLESYYH